jgi:hypothetical protein
VKYLRPNLSEIGGKAKLEITSPRKESVPNNPI